MRRPVAALKNFGGCGLVLASTELKQLENWGDACGERAEPEGESRDAPVHESTVQHDLTSDARVSSAPPRRVPADFGFRFGVHRGEIGLEVEERRAVQAVQAEVR